MVTNEISKTLPFLLAEKGWVSIYISITHPVLRCRFLEFGFKKLLSRWEG